MGEERQTHFRAQFPACRQSESVNAPQPSIPSNCLVSVNCLIYFSTIMNSSPLLRVTDAQPVAVNWGARARRDLIAAVAACFADSGLEGATTRQIAALARQNIAAINYYFVAEETYLAVVEHITEIISRRVTPLLDEIDDFIQHETQN